MTIRDLFPASVLAVTGLFLSGLFPLFPVASLLLLLVGGVLFHLLMDRRILPVLFLPAAFLTGSFHQSYRAPAPLSPVSSPFAGCLFSDPSVTRSGSWVLLENGGRNPLLPRTYRLFIPSDRVPVALHARDCLKGTVTPFRRPGPPPSYFRESVPSYRISHWDPLAVWFEPLGTSTFRKDLLRISARLKDHLGSAYPPDTSSLLAAIVLSDTRLIPPTVGEEFQRAGVSHLLSVSGEHMTLLALFLSGAVLSGLRLLPLPLLRRLVVHLPVTRLLVFLTVPVLGAYTVLIGFPPAAVRAFAGFLLVATLRLFFVDMDFEGAVGLSTLLMLSLLPSLLRSLSFDLSLLALWGIVLSRKGISLRLANRTRGAGPAPAGRVREALRAGLTVTLVTAPLIAFVFRNASPSGILSNPVIVPLAGDLFLPLGFLDLLSSLVFSHSLPLVPQSLTLLSHIILGLVRGFSSLPGSQIQVPSPAPLVLVLFYLAVAGLLLVRRSLPPLPTSVLLLLLVATTLGLPGESGTRELRPALRPGTDFPLRYHPETERANLVPVLNGLFPKRKRGEDGFLPKV